MKPFIYYLMAFVVLISCNQNSSVSALDYPIVYTRAPRYGDTTRTRMPDVFHPAYVESGTDLMLCWPDGTKEVLVETGSNGCAMDPAVSLDGTSVYYTFCSNVLDKNVQRKDLPKSGWDIYRIDVATRVITRLTNQEWTPNEGSGTWSSNPLTPVPAGTNYMGFGIVNTGPCPVPGGRVVFTSNRNSYLPTKQFTDLNLQLFVMDDDGANVEQIGFMNLGSALHPVLMRTGEIMFSSYETQGRRDARLWGLWVIGPDGTGWGPLHSAFQEDRAFHFSTQLPNGRIVVTDYYNLNDNGFGSLVAFDDPASAIPHFGTPTGITVPSSNVTGTDRHHFPPPALVTLSPWSTGNDRPSAAGKLKQPSAAPGGDLLVVYTPGPAFKADQPVYDSGIYLLRNGTPTTSPSDLVLIRNKPEYNEEQPVALVPWAEIHGEDPPELPWLPDATNAFGYVGTPDLRWRNTAPWIPASNWKYQGADLSTGYTDAEIKAVRIVVLEPQTWRSYGPNTVYTQTVAPFRQQLTGFGAGHSINERHRILGEVPLQTDGSFLAKIPADVPFTFQTLDAQGRVLNMAQTWHQVRPGERRTDCGGCHAHNRIPKDFETSIAGQPGFVAADLTAPPVDIEWRRDVQSIVGWTWETANAASIAYQSRASSLYQQFPNPAVARWIDLGCPEDTGVMGWFHDELKPTLVVITPRRDSACPEIRWADYDFKGISSRSVKASFPVAGRPAGAELSDLAQVVAPGVRRITVNPPVAAGTVTVRVVDGTGHSQKHVRRFSGFTQEQILRTQLEAWIAALDGGASADSVTQEICQELCQ